MATTARTARKSVPTVKPLAPAEQPSTAATMKNSRKSFANGYQQALIDIARKVTANGATLIDVALFIDANGVAAPVEVEEVAA